MRHKRAQGGGGVGVQLSLIVTPMLDMSFQVLAFFIMTYHPSALEGHIPGSLVPPETIAKKSKDANVNPNENLLSVPDDELLPDLQGAITVKVKAIQKGEEVGSRVEGSPGQIFIKTSLETEPELVADVNIDLKKVALPRLEARLKEMLSKGGATHNTNVKIAADGELRQQYVMMIYDTIKGAKIKDADNKSIGFEKIHFVPPPVLNANFKK
jgi:biopolymer transport protein ExbD